MLSNSCDTLVGERCPASEIQKGAINRNNYGIAHAGSCWLMPERCKNAQEDWHTIDTRNRKIVRLSFSSPQIDPEGGKKHVNVPLGN